MLFSRNKYKVSLKGRSSVVYSEYDKIITFNAEPYLGELDFLIYSLDNPQWQEPNNDELIDQNEYEVIKTRVVEEFKMKGIKVEWH